MLLFCDGFDEFNAYDVGRKWGVFEWSNPSSSAAGPPLIVFGEDRTFSPAKLYATSPYGRALQGKFFKLTALIKPSRTLFLGFAHRIASKSANNTFYNLEIRFLKGVVYDKVAYGVTAPSSQVKSIGTTVAECYLRLYPSYIDVTWRFPMHNPQQTQTGRIYPPSAVLDSGDFRYYQIGMSLMGNVAAQPTAWAEVRLGSRGGANNLVFRDIMTGPESGANATFLIDAVSLRVGAGNSSYPDSTTFTYAAHGIDDLYICNDEGHHNNGFLGNVKVHRVSVSGDGSENQGVPYGEAFRFHTVDEDFIDTVQALPSPLPDPETNPTFIEWEGFDHNYLTLERLGDRQLFRFTSLQTLGSTSKIHGAILHTLLKPESVDTPATINAVRKYGFDRTESIPMDAPLIRKSQFEARHFVWENEETVNSGGEYVQWSNVAVDNSEWGLELMPVTIDPASYDPAVVRLNIVFDEPLGDEIGLADLTHRYFEDTIEDSLTAEDDSVYEYIWMLYDALEFEEAANVNRAGNRFLNETLEFAEYLPYVTEFGWSVLGLDDEAFVQYIDLIAEEIDAADWADGHWEELFEDGFDATDLADASYILTLDEAFGLEEPYIWDGHEDVEESLEINVSYVWSGQELIEEYIHPEDYTKNGFGHDLNEVLDLAEGHHDAWWVELHGDHANLADGVLTQHWRYETLFGMVVASWQVDPVEQYGNDGDHTGDNPWGA